MKKIIITIFTLLKFSSAIAQNYDEVLKKFQPKFNGVVLIANQGKIEYLKGFGLENRNYKKSISPQTKFRICSITKTFTSVLILQLVEKNKIRLDDKISKFFPNYRGEAANKVTIHQLLTYSSGIENLDQRSEEMYALKMPIDTIINRYCSGKLVSEPGKQFDYKNAEFIILGKILESFYQKPFENILNEQILIPLQMKNTGLLTNGSIIENMASSYLYHETSNTYQNDDPYWIENFYSAGAMYSTAEDLLRFDQAIFNHKILNKNTVDTMLRPNPELWYVAYGFWVTENEYLGKKYLSADRQGNISANNTSWLHLINNNRTYIILSNTDSIKISDLRQQLVEQSLK